MAIALLLSVFSGLAVAQLNNSAAAEKWRIHGWLDGNDLEAECKFAQVGSTIRGTCTTEQGTTDIIGQGTGSMISWSYSTDYNGTFSTIRYAGAISGRKMTGKIAVSPDGASGAFTANLIR